jgi:hypothetical protein
MAPNKAFLDNKNTFSSTNQPKTKRTFIKAVTRTDISKYLCSLPLSQLMEMNQDLKDYCNLKFGENAIDEMTGEMALEFGVLVKLIMNPTGKDYEIYKNEKYGKRKEEEEEHKNIELPVMQDPIDMFLNMSQEDFDRLSGMRTPKALPENIVDEFELKEIAEPVLLDSAIMF